MTVVLLTGASGFVGRQILSALSDIDSVTVHTVRHFSSVQDSCRSHEIDLFDGRARRDLLRRVGAEILIHAAWFVEPGKFWSDTSNLDWLKLSIALVDEFYAFGGRRIVGVGTMAEYDWTAPQPMSETTSLRPATLYGKSKAATFEAVKRRHESHTGEFAWARLFNLFGPYEREERLVPLVIRSLLAGREALCTHGRQVRDFMDVVDSGRAIARLALSSVTGPINVASGVPVKQADLVLRLTEICGRPDLVRLGAIEEREGDPPILTADVGRLTGEVGFASCRPLNESLEGCVRYWSKWSEAQTSVSGH